MEGNVTKRDPDAHDFTSESEDRERYLILHNDDVNTFDHVIKSLVQVCNHDSVQAEQCAFITHYKGKCDIKTGEIATLLPMREGLTLRGLIVTID